MPAASAGRGSARTAVVWDALCELVDKPSAGRLAVVDLGGGTGGFAVPLAERGHDVVVVDASADALATCERRAAEQGVAVRGVQGDATDLPELVRAASADLVLCHSVLEYVDDPRAVLATVARVLRPGGTASVLAANRTAVVVHRALGGRFAEARRALDDPAGRWGDADPVPRRFGEAELVALVTDVGLVSVGVQGVRVFTDLVAGGVANGEPGAAEAMLALDQAAASHPELRSVATQLHLLASRPA